MTKFNPENKDSLTIGETLSPAMDITDPLDAQQYLTDYVTHIRKHLDEEPRDNDMTAEDIAKSNLGYFAGYYNDETRARVEELFTCSHPIFGTIKDNGSPTPEQAFKMGEDIAKNNQK